MSQLDRRQALRLFGAVSAASLAAPALSACGNDGSDSEAANLPPVKIGVIYPQTGPLKSDGDDLANGFRLFMKRNGNRLGGRPAEVLYADEGGNKASGKAALEKLLKENVSAVAGVVSSAVMTEIMPTIEEAKIPLVGSNGSPSSVRSAKYMWRTSWYASDPGLALGRYVAENTSGSVALMAPDYEAGKDFIDGFKKSFLGANGRIEKIDGNETQWTKFLPTAVTEFRAELAKIKASPAKAVYCFYAGKLAVEFMKQYREVGLSQQLYAPGFLTEGQPLRDAGPAAGGIMTVMNYSPDLDTPANRSFAVDYYREYKLVPTTFAQAAFDAGQVLDLAIGLAGRDLSGPRLNDAIGKVGEINSPRGSWRFGANKTPLQRWFLRQVRMDGTQLSNVVVAELITLDGTV